MNNNNQKSFNPFIAAVIGGTVGAAIVYLCDEKRRKKIVDTFEEIVEDGKENGYELKDKINKTIKSGRKNLAKKIRQVENRIAQT